MQFLAPEMLPYSVSFLIFLTFAFLEVMVLLLGWGMFDILDDLFSPEQADVDLNIQTSLGSLFAYINPHKVPFSMLLISFFFVFAFLGTLIQNIFGLLPLLITLPISSILTFISLRHISSFIASLLPKETSEVVSTDSFVGKKALILDPIAKEDLPARAKIKDIYGEVHYIRVEPLNPKETFKEGDIVLIIEKKGLIFFIEQPLKF